MSLPAPSFFQDKCLHQHWLHYCKHPKNGGCREKGSKADDTAKKWCRIGCSTSQDQTIGWDLPPVFLQANERVSQKSRRAIAHIEISWTFWAACLGLKSGWRGFWARPVIFHEIHTFLQISWDPDVRFQCAELYEATVLGNHMIASFSIGPRTLLNDCSHSATAIFWRSAMHSLFLKTSALQLLQQSSKSASTTPQRPIWNSFCNSWSAGFLGERI